MVTKGLEKGGSRGVKLFNGYRVSGWDDEKVLEIVEMVTQHR